MRESDDERPGSREDVFDEDGETVAIASNSHLRNGTDVGGYVIDGELGTGTMGVVYAATHPVIGKRAAIKVLKPELSGNPAAVERFVMEARAVNQIGHPNIVDIFAFGTLPDGRSYYVMDLLAGEPLRQRIKRGGPLHPAEAISIIDETASALIAAHDKGIIHRDLKPDNIFMVAVPGRWPEVRLLDWGLLKLNSQKAAISSGQYRTLAGSVMGTPVYMSPEQARAAESVDFRTDIYSLGVMSYELLAGVVPFKRGSSIDTLLAHQDEPVPPLVEKCPALPIELLQLIEAMLSKEADGRPTLAAVRAVIKRLKGTKIPTMTAAGLAMPTAANPFVESPTVVTATEEPPTVTDARPVSASITVPRMSPAHASSPAIGRPSATDEPATVTDARPVSAASTVPRMPPAHASSPAAGRTPTPPAAGRSPTPGSPSIPGTLSAPPAMGRTPTPSPVAPSQPRTRTPAPAIPRPATPPSGIARTATPPSGVSVPRASTTPPGGVSRTAETIPPPKRAQTAPPVADRSRSPTPRSPSRRAATATPAGGLPLPAPPRSERMAAQPDPDLVEADTNASTNSPPHPSINVPQTTLAGHSAPSLPSVPNALVPNQSIQGLPMPNHGMSIPNHGMPALNQTGPIPNYGMSTPNHGMPVLNQGAPMSNQSMPMPNHGMPTPNHGMPALNQTGPMPNYAQGTPTPNHGMPMLNQTGPMYTPPVSGAMPPQYQQPPYPHIPPTGTPQRMNAASGGGGLRRVFVIAIAAIVVSAIGIAVVMMMTK